MEVSPLPNPPPELKAIQGFVRLSNQLGKNDLVISYWLRFHCMEQALKIDRSTPSCKEYLSSIMVWLESFKKSHKDNEAITNETVGQAHYDNFVTNLFNKSDSSDRNGLADKTTATMFYMASVLYDAMNVFGPIDEDTAKKLKYAKFKAAYILKCINAGQVPKPGPIDDMDMEAPAAPSNPKDVPSTTNYSTDISNDKPAATSSDTQYQSTSNNSSLVLPETPDKEASANNSNHGYVSGTADYGSNSTNTSRNTSTIESTKFHATNGAPLNVDDLVKSQKYCKFASSALQYDDVDTAVSNLEKALKLLTTGQRSD